MATTGESTNVQVAEHLPFRDLPLELKEMVLGYLDNIEDVGSLRLVCKDMVPWEFLWKVPYRVLLMKESVKKLWHIAMTQQRSTNNGACRDALPEHIKTIVFEGALPLYTSDIDVVANEIDHGRSRDDRILSNAFSDYCQGRYSQLHNRAMGNIISTALHNLDSVATMLYNSLSASNLDEHPPSDQDRRNLILASNRKGAHEFAKAMWMNRNIMLRSHTQLNESRCLELFHDATEAVVRNRRRKKKLHVYIKTNRRSALYRSRSSMHPIPVNQLGDLLDITYTGSNHMTVQSMEMDLSILSSQRLGTGSLYAGLRELSISGTGLTKDNSIHMGALDHPDRSPDWSRLQKLRLSHTQQTEQSALFLRRQSFALEIHNVYWHGRSFEQYSRGSSLQSVKASGIFVVASGALKVTNAAASGKVIADLLARYRKAGGKLIHIMHKEEAGSPVFTPGTELAEEFKEVKAQDGEETIWKLFPGAFEQTSLHETLQKWGIKKVVLTGYMAHVCVSTTAREAFQKGYEVILVEDAIGDRDIPGVQGDEVTRVALAELGDVFGTVVKSADIK
ncbi:hypothetical protein PTNB85_04255 [Pyrenophora teres f. teres]|nr:hypothetical protein PTNB85_04255 [Pyrenophora teres f. teres]KAE8864352.1 hypothetical protein PTNB29_04316 [Pyrenophora teres f. teres]